MSDNEARLVDNDEMISKAARETNNPWVALFTGILLKHGIYACAFVALGYGYMEKDKSYQLSRDAELDRYINIIQRNTSVTERNTVVTERLTTFLDRQNFQH